MPRTTATKPQHMIHRLNFSIDIPADKSTIWKALWEDAGYRSWAKDFQEGAHVVAPSWEEGSTVHFLDPEKNGIYSVIEKHIPNSTMQFKHIGAVVAGKEQPIDDETRTWSGATEVYSLQEGNGVNTLTIDIDVMDEHLEFMSGKLPEALEKIKSNVA